MSQLTINNLDHYQPILLKTLINGGKIIGFDIDVAIEVASQTKVMVNSTNVIAGFAAGTAASFGDRAFAYVWTQVQ